MSKVRRSRVCGFGLAVLLSSVVLLAFTLLLSVLSLSLSAQTSGGSAGAARGLRASEVMAIQAGGALPANIAHDVATRGLSFHPDADFLALMTKAGADAGVIAALKSAKVSADAAATKPDMELLGKLSDAAVLIKARKYDEASNKLSEALDASFARMETGFVMAELLRLRVQLGPAVEVYGEILEQQPDFPEIHNKASYVLYRLGNDEAALSEAKTAIALYADDAEAHQNAGLALNDMRNFDAAILEFKEALRIKPDFAGAHSGLGLLHARMQDDRAAIEEYKKAIAIDPDYVNAHNNLGLSYKDIGNIGGAIAEFREAKRLSPDNPEFRQNLGSALMQVSPRDAVVELQELAAKFPKFEVCHICLGHGLMWENDLKGAEKEYRTAIQLDPGDASPYVGLGDIRAKEKNYDQALEQYQAAEKVDASDPEGFKSAGKVLLEKKDFAGAAGHLKQAEALAESDWEIHEMYGKALAGSGQSELAISEFKEAVALDPKEGQVISEIGVELEKKGDWVGALEAYKRGAAADAARRAKLLPGQSAMFYDPSPEKQYTQAKVRLADHLAELRGAGKKDEAAELEKRVGMMNASAGTLEKVQEALQTGDAAWQQRNPADAEKAYKHAVELAENLPPGDENMIVALGRLGNAYAMQRKFDDGDAAFHRQLAVIEKTFGPGNPRVTEPLQYLGLIAAQRGNYAEAESYLSRALEINVKAMGENSMPTSESLRMLAGLYESRGLYEKAEPYLLRAVTASEGTADDNMILIPVWGLCDMYDKWGKAEKSQPCWHRANELMEKIQGANSPTLKDSLMAEANALRKLGRNDEAQKLEERVVSIQKTGAVQ